MNNIPTTPTTKRLLKISSVLDKYPVCRAKLYRDIQAGKFPKPIKQDRMSFWLESDIDAFLDSLIKE